MASVAPLVNTTSRPRAPSSAATLLARLLDRHPGDLAFVVDAGRIPVGARAGTLTMASTASGRVGEVDAWSR